MGAFKPTAHGGYRSVGKVTDPFTKWTAVYLLRSKYQALASLQLFVTSIVIPLGKRFIRWRVGERGESTGDEFKAYCLETGTTQEFAAINTPQQIGVFKRVERTLCGMVCCMLVTSGMTASYLCNPVPIAELKMETPYKCFTAKMPTFHTSS